jgi:hypothetical protein
MDVALARSSAMGPATQIRTNRQFLRRALQLAFTELHVSKADQPVCCRDRHRCYVWVPLAPNPSAPADREILRITTTEPVAAPTPSQPTPERRIAPVSTTQSNGDHRTRPIEAPAPGILGDVLAEAEALRDVLHDAFSRTSRLVAALKLQRRQTKAVAQAMASLKQLQLDR